MPKRYKISEEEVREIDKARKKNKDKNIEKRLEALLLHAEGKKREEVAARTGFAKTYITTLVSKYCNQGISAIAEKHYRGNRRNLSIEEEKEFLKGYKELAESGEIVDIKAIRQAYESKVGHTIGKGQIYRVLKRHGWRKVMPRSKHPKKASDEAIAVSKKLTLESKN